LKSQRKPYFAKIDENYQKTGCFLSKNDQNGQKNGQNEKIRNLEANKDTSLKNRFRQANFRIPTQILCNV
jgi:hypothetical protein